MNRERHKYWASYIADVQGRMLLADWKVVLLHEPEEIGRASIGLFHGKRLGHIRLNADFESYARQRQRHAIVHELLHLHLWPMLYHLEMQVRDTEGWRFISTGHDSHEEFATDQLARIIAPRMPLPPKVKA